MHRPSVALALAFAWMPTVSWADVPSPDELPETCMAIKLSSATQSCMECPSEGVNGRVCGDSAAARGYRIACSRNARGAPVDVWCGPNQPAPRPPTPPPPAPAPGPGPQPGPFATPPPDGPGPQPVQAAGPTDNTLSPDPYRPPQPNAAPPRRARGCGGCLVGPPAGSGPEIGAFLVLAALLAALYPRRRRRR